MLGKRAQHRHCRQSSLCLSIPSVTLQLSAPAHSIPIHPAHAHTHIQHAALTAHGEEGQEREREIERESMRWNGGGVGERSVCCANAEIPCCRRLAQIAHWYTYTSRLTHTHRAASYCASSRYNNGWNKFNKN